MTKTRRRAAPLDVVDAHIHDTDDTFLDTDAQNQVIAAFALELARQRRALGVGFGALSALGVAVASRLFARAAFAALVSRDEGDIDRAWALSPHFYAYETRESSARRLAFVAVADALAAACFASGCHASRAVAAVSGRDGTTGRATLATLVLALAFAAVWFALTNMLVVACALVSYALALRFAFASCDDAAETLSRLKRSTYEHKTL